MSERETDMALLEAALRDDAPEPDLAFARELDERVAAGFPRARARRLPSWQMPRRRWMSAVAAVGTLCVVVAVAVATLNGGSEETTFSSAQLEAKPNAGPRNLDEAARDLSGPSASAPLPAAAGETPAGRVQVRPFSNALAGERRVVRSASITLAVKPDDLQGAAGEVGTVAETHGGYVLGSNVSTQTGGSFTLRIPTNRLESTLEELSKIGKVTARTETSQDVTAPFRQTQDRLGNALLELRTLKLRLGHAPDNATADRIRAQIAQVQADIRALSGRMGQLRRRTQMSTVNVTLRQREDKGGAVAGKGDSTGDAWRDAKHNLQEIANFLLRALGIALPLALLAAAAALAARALRRRRRESALA